MPKSKNIHAFDYNKHYTSCLIGDGIKFGFPVYSCFDEVKPFNNNNINLDIIILKHLFISHSGVMVGMMQI